MGSQDSGGAGSADTTGIRPERLGSSRGDRHGCVDGCGWRGSGATVGTGSTIRPPRGLLHPQSLYLERACPTPRSGG